MQTEKNRQQLLSAAFREIPIQVCGKQLRRVSSGSYSVLEDIESPLLGGSFGKTGAILSAVSEYIWLHTAPIEIVSEIMSRSDLPHEEIRRLAFEIDMDEAFGFLAVFVQAIERMSAAIVESVGGDEEPGKPEIPRTGSQGSFTPLELPVIQSVSITSSGKCPSSGHLPTSTPPEAAMDPAASFIMTLPAKDQL